MNNENSQISDKSESKLLSLGSLYVSDFINVDSDARAGKHDLTLVIDDRYSVVRLENCTPTHSMFGKYWYRSGINETMKNELRDIVKSVERVHRLNEGDLWLDIACNDGTLLGYVPSHVKKLGIDPAENSFLDESRKVADDVVQDYFSIDSFNKSKFRGKMADVVTCIAMFYDLDDPEIFLKDVHSIMKTDGIFVIQMSYTPLMIHQLAFDNICHEHVYYWSLIPMMRILDKCNFSVVDVQINETNGGSFRLFIKKKDSNLNSFGTRPYRDVCGVRVKSLIEWEKTLRLEQEDVWIEFFDRIKSLKEQSLSFIRKVKSEGKSICGYGASTKGNTLLQYFGLDNTLIDAIAERSHYKFGLKTIGTNIPIKSEEEIRIMNPDYMLVLPWHFISEFVDREYDYLKNGGKFIVPCPEFKVIGIEDLK